jgi:RNA ligase (TIGR02306 family)
MDLGIHKWEPPIPAQLQGTMKGQFPSYIPKTDQERCQNLRKEIFEEHKDETYEVTEKLEGTSYTFFIRDGEFNVCSRNINLKETEGNTFWEVARKYNIEETLYKFSCKGLAFQAEIVGPSIQNNIYNLRDIKFYVFDIYDIESGVYFGSEKRQDLCEELGFDHVPVLEFIQINNKSIEDIVSMADGFSQLNNKILREGIVFKSLCGSFHFKSVSNKYLMKTDL